MDLNAIIGANFTILIGVFITLAVMGTTTLYDKYKSKDKTSINTRELKPPSDLNEKMKIYSSKVMDGLAEFSNKFSSLIQKKVDKKNLENSEINHPKSSNDIQKVILNNLSEFSKKFSSLIPKKVNKNNLENSEIKTSNLTGGIPKIFGSIRSKISSFSSTISSKNNKIGSGKNVLQSDKKAGTSKFSKTDKISGFDFDEGVESKKDELDFDDNLTQMSNASSIKNNKSASPNSDLTSDKSEFDIGFEALNNEASEDDLLFKGDSTKIDFAGESDTFLESLKKDIVITKEKKINLMNNMQGENLDVKVIRSELQDVLKKLKQYNEYSNHNY
jgi:hypothetical protein